MGEEQTAARSCARPTRFDELVEGVRSEIARICRRRLPSRDLADDACQMVLIQLWKRVRDSDEPMDALSWSRRAALLRCVDVRRSETAYLSRLDAAGSSAHGDLGLECGCPDRIVEREELRAVLVRRVWTLSSRQRDVLVLHVCSEMPLCEVADALGIRVTTARTHLARGVAQLRIQLRARRAPPERRA